VRLRYSEWQISKNVDNPSKSLEEILEKEFGEVVNNNDGTWILDGVEVIINEETGEIVVGEKVKEKTIEEMQEDYAIGNTIARDENGNKIVVLDGFKITNDTKKVHEGIVVEDREENQFVWVPVGEISDGINTHTIKLSRYTFSSDGTPTDMGDAIIRSYFQEETISTGLNLGNTIAKDIEKFISSTNKNGGYYIGRYEASRNNITGKAENKKNKAPWISVTQSNAAIAAREMYETNSNYESDLVNSYTWDTAIVFIQTFGQSNYSKQRRLSSNFLKTGEAEDEQLNINDMAGNLFEKTTETYDNNIIGVSAVRRRRRFGKSSY